MVSAIRNFFFGGGGPKEISKDDDRLKKQQKSVALSKYVRLMVYSYLPDEDIIRKISILSVFEREALKNSELCGAHRSWLLDASVLEKWAAEKKTLNTKMAELNFLLSIVGNLDIRVQTMDPKKQVGDSYIGLQKQLAQLILELPPKFDHKKLKLQINRLNKGLLNVGVFDLSKFNMSIMSKRESFIFREFVFNNASN